MRSAGFTLTALLIAAAVVSAQPPAVPGTPARPAQPLPPAAPAAPKADPKLDAHLAEWEKKMTGLVNFRTEIALKRTEAVFKKDASYKGIVLCMKPKYAILRLDNAADINPKTGTATDYEAYICDGKNLYAYNGLQKTVTEIKLPQGQGVDNLMLDFLAGMKAREVKDRFDITLFNTDEYYIYLDIKPRRPADQREFQHMRMALYGPGPKTAKWAYLPAQVFMLKPNGDTEQWKFSSPQADIENVKPEHFKYVEIKEKGWTFQRAPQQPMGGPVPAGGAVRPGKQ